MNAPRHGHADRGSGGAIVIGCVAIAVLAFSMAIGGAAFFFVTGREPDIAPPAPIVPTSAPIVPPSAAPPLPTPLEDTSSENTSSDDEGTLGLEEVGTIEPTSDPGAPRVTGAVRAGELVANGSLSSDVIRRVLRRHQNEVRYCYELALSRDAALEGTVMATFVIGPDGTVPTASVSESSLPESSAATELTQCLAQAVRRWTFPAPEGGGIVSVRYPIVLSVADESPPGSAPEAEGTIGRGVGPETPPTVRAGSSEVTGSLSREVIQRVVRAHINEVRHCYETGLARDPNLSGQVTVRLVIGATGAVTEASVASTTFPPSSTTTEITTCITTRVARWTFPAPEGGAVTVNYPFVLTPG